MSWLCNLEATVRFWDKDSGFSVPMGIVTHCPLEAFHASVLALRLLLMMVRNNASSESRVDGVEPRPDGVKKAATIKKNIITNDLLFLYIVFLKKELKDISLWL